MGDLQAMDTVVPRAPGAVAVPTPIGSCTDSLETGCSAFDSCSGSRGISGKARKTIENNFISSDSLERKVTEQRIQLPKFLSKGGRKHLVVSLALKRATRFGCISCLVLLAGALWVAVRFYLMIDGENQVSEDNFEKLGSSIARSIEAKISQDLIYQDMIANLWAIEPQISRTKFRSLVMSEAYAPGLETMTGISLIPRIMGSDDRRAKENHPDSDRLRIECCGGQVSVGEGCASLAADGLFCRAEGEKRYQFTQFGPNGLEPAVGNSSEYIERVGREEYMVVDMIEPFSSNAKVWGFNLLSSDARLAAWRSAMQTGKKTFTRRLNLVQSTSAEYGVLVWLPVFSTQDGTWKTALDGRVYDLVATGSVNGVYKVQHMLTTAIETTYIAEQLQDTQILLFDNAAELGGKAQFLAGYGHGMENSYFDYAEADINLVSKDAWMTSRKDLKIANADAKWTVLVIANEDYLGKRRSSNPLYALIISVVVLVGGTVDRWLGHPAFALKYLGQD